MEWITFAIFLTSSHNVTCCTLSETVSKPWKKSTGLTESLSTSLKSIHFTHPPALTWIQAIISHPDLRWSPCNQFPPSPSEPQNQMVCLKHKYDTHVTFVTKTSQWFPPLCFISSPYTYHCLQSFSQHSSNWPLKSPPCSNATQFFLCSRYPRLLALISGSLRNAPVPSA